MKRLVILIILAILLVGLILVGKSDTYIGIADTNMTNIYYIGTTAGKTEAGSSSTSAIIAIAMYAVDDE